MSSAPSPSAGAEHHWRCLGPISDFPEEEITARTVNGVEIAVYNLAGEVLATSNICTHAFALLSDGYLEGETVECPLHAGQFNIRSGEALGPPVTCNLTIYPVRVRNGIVELRLPG